MGSMDAPGYNAGRRRVTADPPIAPGRACYKPRRVRAGSSPLVIAHMAVESARLVAGNEVTAAMPAAGFRERAGYHRTRTTRCPRMGAVRVPGSTRHQDARMSLVFVSGSDWPPAPTRFNAPRGGLRAASIRNKRCVSSVSTDARATFPGLILGAPCRRLQAIIARGTSVVLSISHEPSAESHGRIRACCCETLHEHWVT